MKSLRAVAEIKEVSSDPRQLTPVVLAVAHGVRTNRRTVEAWLGRTCAVAVGLDSPIVNGRGVLADKKQVMDRTDHLATRSIMYSTSMLLKAVVDCRLGRLLREGKRREEMAWPIGDRIKGVDWSVLRTRLARQYGVGRIGSRKLAIYSTVSASRRPLVLWSRSTAGRSTKLLRRPRLPA